MWKNHRQESNQPASRTLYRMMKHQDARYIPQRRIGDRRWRDRFPIWRLALAVFTMVVVAFVLFQLFCRCA
jgi:hypothetical protein